MTIHHQCLFHKMKYSDTSRRRLLQHPKRSIKFIYLTALLATLLATLIEPVDPLRNPWRSVKKCDQTSTIVKAFLTDRDCLKHCEQTYVRVSFSSWDANVNLAQSLIQPSTTATGATRQCCCLFNAPWPEFVRPESIGRKLNEWNKLAGKSDCLPLVVSINLSARTKNSYDTVCKYLNRKEPLTMLEVMRFAGAASYLNYMQPKHPVIWKTMKRKEVERLQKEAASELETVFFNELLDEFKPFESYEGNQLQTKRLERFIETRKTITKALKSRIVAQAFDELVISHALVDVRAAALYVSSINKLHLRIPANLIEGDYDKYNKDAKAAYFTLANLDCRLLATTKNKLSIYLSVLKSLLGSLYEKLIYEHMGEECRELINLIHSERTYSNLIELSCGRNSKTN